MQYKPKYFKGYELVSGAMYDIWGERALEYFDDRILCTLDDIRKFFGTTVTVNTWHWGGATEFRGYREPECTVGADWSMHRFGKAMDCIVKGVSGTEARDVIMNHQNKFPYITRIEDDVSHLHFDNKNVFHHGILLFRPQEK